MCSLGSFSLFNVCRAGCASLTAFFGRMKGWQRWLCFFIFSAVYSLVSLLPYVGLFGMETVLNVFRGDVSQLLILFQPFYEVATPWLLFLLMGVPFIRNSFDSGVLGKVEKTHLSFFSEESDSVYKVSGKRYFYTLFWVTLFIAGTTCFADYMVGASVYGQYDTWGYFFSCFPSSFMSAILGSFLLYFVYRWLRVGFLWFASKLKAFNTSARFHFWLSWIILIFAVLFWCSYNLFAFYSAFAYNISPIMVPYMVSNFLATPVLMCAVNRVRNSVWSVLGVGLLYSVTYFVGAIICTLAIHALM